MAESYVRRAEAALVDACETQLQAVRALGKENMEWLAEIAQVATASYMRYVHYLTPIPTPHILCSHTTYHTHSCLCGWCLWLACARLVRARAGFGATKI